MSTQTQTLTDLARRLADVLDLPASLDLPELCAVNLALRRNGASVTQTITAQLMDIHSADAVQAWAAATGGTVTLSEAYPAHSPTARQHRKLAVQVSHAGLAVEVWTSVGADFVLPTLAEAVTSL
jgi:hypothetical protein